MAGPSELSGPRARGTCLDPERIRAITLDLDDTLWPVWPTIAHAEARLQAWLGVHAPAAQQLGARRGVLRAIRAQVQAEHAGRAHDLSLLRREAIRQLLCQAGEDPALAEEAFEVFLAARQEVALFDDALPALELLASRWPLVALSNGNADVRRIGGLDRFFHAAVSACEAGVAKPDARIFQQAAAAASVRPEQVLHVGDDALLDAQGALDAGMQAVWLRRTPQQLPPAQRPAAAHDPAPAAVAPDCPEVIDLHALCRLLGLV